MTNSKSRFKRILIIGFILLFLIIIAKKDKNNTATNNTGRNTTTNNAIKIPDKFASVYSELDKRLDDFSSQLEKSQKSNLLFGAQLVTADSHRGEDLLAESQYEGNLVYLDRLQALGVNGVTFPISYPVLREDFPRSNEYLDFYKKLTKEVKRRGLKVTVQVGLIFTQKEFSKLGLNYSDLSVDQYYNEKRRMVHTITREIQPDYLTIGNEPTSEGDLLGKKITTERYIQYINDALRGLDKGKVLVGAGAGNWDDVAVIENLAKIPQLDYIDIHIYPIGFKNTDLLKRASEMADIAKTNNKRIIMSEIWLYKAIGNDVLGGVATTPNIFGRDAFSFWAPLDQKFLEVMTKFAQSKGIEYISPFWTKYLFAYLDYETHKNKSAGELLSTGDIESVKNIMAKKFSDTGLKYKEIIQSN